MKDRIAERIEYLGSEGSGPLLFDLSRTGAAILYNKIMRKGAQIKVEISGMVLAAQVILSARVVYSQERTDGYRIGVQFLSVPSDLQAKLDETVENFSRGVPIKCKVMEEPVGIRK